MKSKKNYIILSLICLFTYWYILNTTSHQNIFKMINQKRLRDKNNNNTTTSINLSDYTFNENNKYSLGISEDELKYLSFRYSLTESGEIKYKETNLNTDIIELTKEEAISDINFLFNTLKYSYVGYIYFGGDEIWNNCKNNIINSINSYQDKIISSDLEKIIFNNLNFIQDGHFSINFNSLLQKTNFYYSEVVEIKKENNNYYVDYLNNKWYIKSINNDSNIENYIKLSLNKDGKLCNYIGFLSNIELKKMKIILSSNNVEEIIYIDLIKNTPYSNQTLAYNYEKINNIPIFTIKRMYNINSNDNSMELFIESANKIKNENYVIIDIRGNIGGNDFGVIEWSKNFIGKIPKENMTFISLTSLINNTLIKRAFEENSTEKPSKNIIDESILEQRKRLLELASSNENKWFIEVIRNESNNLIKNNTKIFVIMDSNVSSSGETFVRILKNIENVIFVGTNTAGVGLSDATNECILPNSNITIIYGSNLNLYNDFIEGVGFQPDIWIGDEDNVIERILNFLN